MSAHNPKINRTEEDLVNLSIEGEVWRSFETKCVKAGKNTEEILKQLMNSYINASSSLDSVKSLTQVEPDLDRLVSDYVNQKIEDFLKHFLKQQLEVKIANLFEYYLKLHLKQKIQAALQTSLSSSQIQPTQPEVMTSESKPPIQEQFSPELNSDEFENLLNDFFVEPETLTIESDPRELVDSKADESVRESLTSTEKNKIKSLNDKPSPSQTSQDAKNQNYSHLKTAKELSEILDISPPYIATLNRIGELQQRGWQDSGHRQGKTILYEPI